MRCWKMYMLNHQDEPEVGLELSGNITRVLISNKEGLQAGGRTMTDRMACPSVNDKLEAICPQCQFHGPEDLFNV